MPDVYSRVIGGPFNGRKIPPQKFQDRPWIEFPDAKKREIVIYERRKWNKPLTVDSTGEVKTSEILVVYVWAGMTLEEAHEILLGMFLPTVEGDFA